MHRCRLQCTIIIAAAGRNDRDAHPVIQRKLNIYESKHWLEGSNL